MFFQRIQVAPLDVNCYILAKEDNAICIDPGGSPEKIIKILEDNNLSLEAIINTHAHFDHVGANAALAEKYDCPVYVHESDLKSLEDSVANLSVWFNEELKTGYEIKLLHDNENMTLGGLDFEVIHTPGHTPGCVCLLQNGNLFTGDTLFNMSIGRTDLPGSNQEDMRQSLVKLKSLDPSLKVYPGHNEPTTLADELRNNPFLK